VGNPPLDSAAFDAFEAGGWEEKAVALVRNGTLILDPAYARRRV
jgi:hypothetical protein